MWTCVRLRGFLIKNELLHFIPASNRGKPWQLRLSKLYLLRPEDAEGLIGTIGMGANPSDYFARSLFPFLYVLLVVCYERSIYACVWRGILSIRVAVRITYMPLIRSGLGVIGTGWAL